MPIFTFGPEINTFAQLCYTWMKKEVIHPNVSDLLGLLLLVVFALLSVDDHQPICAKNRQVGYP